MIGADVELPEVGLMVDLEGVENVDTRLRLLDLLVDLFLDVDRVGVRVALRLVDRDFRDVEEGVDGMVGGGEVQGKGRLNQTSSGGSNNSIYCCCCHCVTGDCCSWVARVRL